MADNGLTSDIQTHAPFESIKVKRRNGELAEFNIAKIANALKAAFLDTEGQGISGSQRLTSVVNDLAVKAANGVVRTLSPGQPALIESIQDQVELTLMREGHHKVAREYVLYREAHAAERAAEQSAEPTTEPEKTIFVVQSDGSKVAAHTIYEASIRDACTGLDDVDPELVIKAVEANIYDGIGLTELGEAETLCARQNIEREPNFTYVAARLLLAQIRVEALAKTGVHGGAIDQAGMAQRYPEYFKAYIHTGVDHDMLARELSNYDLDRLGDAIVADRDLQFTYLGLQTFYDRYLLHVGGTRFETPQALFMRVAMGLAINEAPAVRDEMAIKFYDVLSSFDFMSSTPTLFNAGTLRPQLSSCYLTNVGDDLDDIYEAIKDNALLSKFAGGLGNDWTPVRSMGAHIKGTNGKSQGVVPFLKVANDTAVAVNQGGRRKGAVCAYLETWHKDIEEFLDLRKNTGDDRRRTHDMHTANWIPDLFVKRVINEQQWTLFSPNDVPELHDLMGAAFEKAYVAYEAKADTGEITNFKRIPAIKLWRKMLEMLFETGHPWFTFKDPCNLRSPQQHIGVVHSSNLCTEITLNTKAREEIAVCNLGSVNIARHMGWSDNHGQFVLNVTKLRKTVSLAMRMLDNVIDYNYYSVKTAHDANLRHRPVGLGLMGFQDALYQIRTPYDSQMAVAFADEMMEAISYFAIEASSDLAKERGSYASFEGSLWSQGILPIDSIDILARERGEEFVDMDRDSHCDLDWTALREKVKSQGMRNSNCMAIAPTATIANITGTSQSIEPTYQNLYVKSNLSGEFTVINPHLAAALKAHGLWDAAMVHDLKYYDGSVQPIDRIPTDLKAIFKNAFEIDPEWLIEAGSRRQKWLDQSQSLNLYMARPNGPKLDKLYKLAWTKGLKTTYYLRTVGATHAEKSTIEDRRLNAVSQPGSAAPAACSIDDPECSACE